MPELLNGATSEPYRLEVYSVDGDTTMGTLKVVNIDNGEVLLEREFLLMEGSHHGVTEIDMLRCELLAEEAIEDYEDANSPSVNNQGA